MRLLSFVVVIGMAVFSQGKRIEVTPTVNIHTSLNERQCWGASQHGLSGVYGSVLFTISIVGDFVWAVSQIANLLTRLKVVNFRKPLADPFNRSGAARRELNNTVKLHKRMVIATLQLCYTYTREFCWFKSSDSLE
jgi:hypothetical protein